ncbi:MAG: hypothetical protein QJT81_12460 [Candidatus Thiothrix putei]|uniref:Uncharacterized protein n=1 Tax=Candidatus Thiothrix putei TaxID=3080811 RepID=A0AA95H8S5_9GAMM|nr:MAG: hypothetical protein QJT81_12460 [Candidatus Thiothrix putei]
MEHKSIALWNKVLPEINFASGFNLTEEMKLEADKLLLILKRGIFKSNDENEALKLVFQYNHSVNELVAPLFSQNLSYGISYEDSTESFGS